MTIIGCLNGKGLDKNKGRVRSNVFNWREHWTKKKVKLRRGREDVNPVLLFTYPSIDGTVLDRVES